MGKRVLVTGVSSGIGLATARYLADRGFHVVGTLRDASRLPRPDDDRIAFVPLDVTSEPSIAEGVRAALDHLGGIDILVNNAGVSHFGPFEQTPLAEGRRILETNLLGVAAMCRQITPVMRAQRSGLIVTIGSMGGHMGIPFQSYYVASKWAVAGLCESLRLELMPFGIRVVVIDPGDIKTRIGQNRRYVTDVSSDYRPFYEKARAAVEKTETAQPPDVVAQQVYRVIQKKHPKARYPTGKGMAATSILLKLLPWSIRDRIFIRYYGIQTAAEETDD